MSTLTDRYVWGVLRAIPQAQRAELEPEIRALVADAVEARMAGGASPEAAERAALVELGDPELLAARYTDRTMHLIGPRFFTEWKRLVAVILPIAVPLAIVLSTGAAYIGGRPPNELVGIAITTGLGAAMQVVFWVTLGFAIAERVNPEATAKDLAWTPDRLPELPAGTGPNVVELVFTILALAIAAGAIVWQQVARPITIDGSSFPLFDPVLWSFWLPWFLAILALELVFTIVRWARGGWTWVLAGVNLVLNAAFAVPAVWLLQNRMLLDPGLVAELDRLGVTPALEPTAAITVVVIVAVTAWDSIDGFRETWLRTRAQPVGLPRAVNR